MIAPSQFDVSSRTEPSQLAEFVKELINSVEQPTYPYVSQLQDTFSTFHTASQEALQTLPLNKRSELLFDLCKIFGYYISGENKFVKWACPIVSVNLPLGLIVNGALLDLHTVEFNDQEVIEAILSIATEATFVLVLDCEDQLSYKEPTKSSVALVSVGYLANLITGILALRYWENVHQEIPPRNISSDQLKLFLDKLEVSLGTVQLIAKGLHLPY